MFQKPDILKMADAMATHAGTRMGVIAANVANADTPGYRAQDLPEFASAYDEAGRLRVTRPGHRTSAQDPSLPMVVTSGGAEAPNGNSVSLEVEMVRAVEVRQQHDMALAIYQSASRLLRTSLGRGG
ncbi:FlgB family protein [Cereibacter changlensis]|uniref:FlgB family protein n=1 Tax=Cereibacter changlensis TaxID=402884 RepID=UPI004034491A